MSDTVHQRLLDRTAPARQAFLSAPLISRALAGEVDRALYLAFLAQAYHHVSQTVPLLARALSRCGGEDQAYQRALIAYIDEEKGHDEWILEDIAALGGDAEAVRKGSAGQACRIMCGYAASLIDHVSPYGLLGMVHVLEGMSVALATQVAAALAKILRPASGAGFSYLTSHGDLDQDHVRFFQDLVNGITDPACEELIITAANDFYLLYGAVLTSLETQGTRDAA
jgi:pyrroloquinoline quinone (PQQ) biosynthesis protein C